MRAFVVLVVLATLVAGCNNPVKLREPAEEPVVPLPWADLEPGRGFGAVVAPDWKPGYRFTYEEEGAMHETSSGDILDERQAVAEDTTWGPRQGLNYTVANVTASFGTERILAIHADTAEQGGAQRLLLMSPHHLEPIAASVGMWCDNGYYDGRFYVRETCNNVIEQDDEVPDAEPLDFPLEDGERSIELDAQVHEPYVPWQPVDVVTRVLGMKEVQGPFGKVQAVHVHQELRLNFTDVGNQDDWGPQDFVVDGQVRAERDVYYAPALLNVVLDQSVTEGRLNGSYKLDGQPHSFARSWRGWSAERLVDVALREAPAMTLDEIAGRIRYREDPGVAQLYLQASMPFLNVAEDESTSILLQGLEADPHDIDITVYDGWGNAVASSDSATLEFQPLAPGPYLVAALTHDVRGIRTGRGFALLWATYSAAETVSCDQLAGDAFGTCPGLEIPMGYPLASVRGVVLIQAPLAGGDSGGRLVLEMGDGQEISADRQGSAAEVEAVRPLVDPYETWTLRYKPELTVGQSVEYRVEAWPDSLPSHVWDRAFQDT